MGLKEWVKKDIKRDIERVKRYPERFIASLIFLGIGVILITVGWHLFNYPPPPRGYLYSYDPHIFGFIAMIVGFILTAISLLVYSTMKVDKEA